MATGVAAGRLAEERRAWRKHPHGFVAKPRLNVADGAQNLLVWECVVPGKAGTPWENTDYPCTLEFTADYPTKPPKARWSVGEDGTERTPFFHLNCYPSRVVCLSILNEDDGWRPGVTVKQILLGLQEWMPTPNPLSPANAEAFHLYNDDPEMYTRRVRKQAQAIARAAAARGA